MTEEFDAIVVGMGPGGEVVAEALLKAGKQVAVVERELIGGECAYWACIPSKTLLRPPEAKAGVDRVAGARGARLDWAAAREYRDYMIRRLDDTVQATSYRAMGATVVKGSARITTRHTVAVAGRVLTAAHVVVATGSQPVVPLVDGLDTVPVWTNREATTMTDVPGRVVVIGGSAAGTELGLLLCRYGAAVTILESADRLLSREDPRPAELATEYLSGEGVTVLTATRARRVHRDGRDTVVELDSGVELRCDVIVLGTGRRPRTDGLGLGNVDVELGERGELVVDEHCWAGDGVWGVGDVTAVMPFTHVATYQGRVVADNILGRPRAARYDGIPRVVFIDPELGAVGLTHRQAQERGLSFVSAEIDLAKEIARPWTYEQEPRGHLGVLADRERRVLLGAWAIGPQASEWIHTAALAIREEIPLDRLLDQVAQFPSYNEGWLKGLQRLEL